MRSFISYVGLIFVLRTVTAEKTLVPDRIRRALLTGIKFYLVHYQDWPLSSRKPLNESFMSLDDLIFFVRLVPVVKTIVPDRTPQAL
jgi:hypothetical protein